jgi:inner membrane protein COX18
MATALLRHKQACTHFSSKTINTINLTPIFLHLPASYRSFHASPRPQFLDAGVTTAHTLLETLHSSTGLSWVYTLPLAALTLRTTLILPLSIYSRRISQKQASLSPLVQSWQHVLRDEVMHEAGHMGPEISQQKLLWRMRQKRSEIYARWGCQIWKTMLPLVQLPVWLTAIEAVRAMCGAKAGLLGMILRSDNTVDAAFCTGIPTELTLATEGALWFPDLLVPDPQLILPFLLSGAVFLNLSNSRGSGANQAVWQKRVQRSLKIVALALGPLTLQVPSAMLVYWISSSLLAYIQAVVLDKAMPIPPATKPCNPTKRWRNFLDRKGAEESRV